MYKAVANEEKTLENQNNNWEKLKQEALSERANREESKREKNNSMGDVQIADGAPGCEASSSDWNPKHPPHHAINSNPQQFWCTSGLSPAELVIKFGDYSSLRSIEIISVGIKRLEILKSERDGGTQGWDSLCIEDVDDADGEVQRLSPNIPFGEKAQSIKVRIISGYGACVCIYKCGVTGSSLKERDSPNKGGRRELGPGSLSSRLGASPKK